MYTVYISLCEAETAEEGLKLRLGCSHSAVSLSTNSKGPDPGCTSGPEKRVLPKDYYNGIAGDSRNVSTGNTWPTKWDQTPVQNRTSLTWLQLYKNLFIAFSHALPPHSVSITSVMSSHHTRDIQSRSLESSTDRIRKRSPGAFLLFRSDYYKRIRLSPSASGSTLPAKKRPRVIVREWRGLSTEERHRWKCLARRLPSERNDTDLNDFESDGSHGNDANDVGSTTGDLSSAAEYPGGPSRNFGNIGVYKEQVNQTINGRSIENSGLYIEGNLTIRNFSISDEFGKE
ncbi:hypothetical protein K435DRAFT_812007 [Dendrothele bispora CBS 962.96]|uniref:HMG box domain-containing protein n=1 Tax=Dendrothele bispora (strain CBS 962.96) TaxID=1314807 RepID=A0A4S8KQD4_DENBC|nr:hypothetical protein K435DRAFT_812007 [Dendrothele bispora CBS 962.96]